ncbi:MAG: 50S ribosomal protein L25 [Fidelibacterota bacterium]
MAEFYKLEFSDREELGSRGAKAVRKAGMIPANYYFHGEKNVNLAIDEKQLWRALHSGNRIFEVHLKDARQFVMVKEVQYHPVTDEIIHVDFMRVRRKEKATFTVTVELVGESIGVKQGGVLMQSLTAVDVSCFPTDVPDSIKVNVEDVDINDTLHVSDLILDGDVEILTDPEAMLLSVQPPKMEEETVEEEDEFAEEEGVEPPATEEEEEED